MKLDSRRVQRSTGAASLWLLLLTCWSVSKITAVSFSGLINYMNLSRCLPVLSKIWNTPESQSGSHIARWAATTPDPLPRHRAKDLRVANRASLWRHVLTRLTGAELWGGHESYPSVETAASCGDRRPLPWGQLRASSTSEFFGCGKVNERELVLQEQKCRNKRERK